VSGLRQEFIEALPPEDVTRFKFVDETSVNRTHTRRHGRAPGGPRLDRAAPLHRGPNGTVVALTPQRVVAVVELAGAANTARFAVSLEQVPGPTRQRGRARYPARAPGGRTGRVG